MESYYHFSLSLSTVQEGMTSKISHAKQKLLKKMGIFSPSWFCSKIHFSMWNTLNFCHYFKKDCHGQNRHQMMWSTVLVDKMWDHFNVMMEAHKTISPMYGFWMTSRWWVAILPLRDVKNWDLLIFALRDVKNWGLLIFAIDPPVWTIWYT